MTGGFIISTLENTTFNHTDTENDSGLIIAASPLLILPLACVVAVFLCILNSCQKLITRGNINEQPMSNNDESTLPPPYSVEDPYFNNAYLNYDRPPAYEFPTSTTAIASAEITTTSASSGSIFNSFSALSRSYF